MRSTWKSEATELARARAARQRSREALREGPQDAAASPRWVRVALRERRGGERLAVDVLGGRRRSRPRRWRRASGRLLAPPTPDEARPTVHQATMRFLGQPGAHDTHEDLHPSALDPEQAALQHAIAQGPLARRIAEREARDA